MPSHTRRHLLRSSAVLAVTLAGCVSDSSLQPGGDETTQSPSQESETNSPSTASPTTEPASFDTSTIGSSASVVSQATAEQPAIVEFELTNEGDEEVSVVPEGYGGLPLEYIPPLEGADETVMLYPREPEHVHIFNGKLATSRTDGCWRFVTEEGSDPHVGWDDLAFDVKLAPDDSYTVQHGVYSKSTEGPCFSAGEYRTDYSLAIGDWDESLDPFTVEISVTVEASEDVSIAVERAENSS